MKKLLAFLLVVSLIVPVPCFAAPDTVVTVTSVTVINGGTENEEWAIFYKINGVTQPELTTSKAAAEQLYAEVQLIIQQLLQATVAAHGPVNAAGKKSRLNLLPDE